MAAFQQDPYMQSSQLPPETLPPNDYPPSSGLPPDAMMALSGMQGGMPPGGGQAPMAADSIPPSSPGPIAGAPGADPMQAAKMQFDQIIGALTALTEAYPMAQAEFEMAGEAIARGMLKVAQGVQQQPMMPPVAG